MLMSKMFNRLIRKNNEKLITELPTNHFMISGDKQEAQRSKDYKVTMSTLLFFISCHDHQDFFVMKMGRMNKHNKKAPPVQVS